MGSVVFGSVSLNVTPLVMSKDEDIFTVCKQAKRLEARAWRLVLGGRGLEGQARRPLL